jgi:aspartate aminotransferase-like enzyme
VEEEGLGQRFTAIEETPKCSGKDLPSWIAPYVRPGCRLPSLTTVNVPDGVDELAVRKALLAQYGIEIAGTRHTQRPGVARCIMGHSSRPENIVTLLGALTRILR